ncbi:hypothetical protein HPB49_021459 [Dermacentor silvarum]|uniref:Uncharacterized protein n=2 Tax=Dermacentor silvarum TaxID=543639 RepID=A0ACB8D038_DERSI|nr:uncharacterized protein LOC119450801 isoform X1 [Dermacentor silvarum]KAH7954748.1 hypothetical protein HPB49_021459 [Dermacentor silvarum]
MFPLLVIRRRPLQRGGQLALLCCQFHTKSHVLRSTAYALDAEEASQAPDLVENRLRLSTCGALYQEWRKARRQYRDAPTDGIEVDVDFVCSAMSADQSSFVETGRPLAVLLHGAPGSYRDFSENLTPRLMGRGVDVLAPNFPDMSFSLRNKFYWHTVEERTALLRDFFKTLGVRRIDTLVSHSASIYPSLRLLVENGDAPKIDSLVLLAPNSHVTPALLKPLWMTECMIQAYRFPVLRPLVSTLVLFMIHSGIMPVKPVVQDIVLSLTTYMWSGFNKGGERLLEAVARKQIPTVVAISENDRLLSYDVLMAVCTVLGASPEDLWRYNKEGQLLATGTSENWLKVLSFENGTHYPFVRHPDICADEIVQLLQRIGALR